MKKVLLTTALVMLASPAFAKEYTIKEVSDPSGSKPYYFEPSNLTIQPGDTVNFVNEQEDMHNVMFSSVPKGVDEMIMSPMFEKEGEKFSYTFTVPGTYQYHCHPHESLGMKGTLIVGQPSKAGETVAMDHQKMTEKAEAKSSGKKTAAAAPAASASADLAQATGKINSVDIAGHKINVTHDPVKSLGWPKMKMEFPVDSSVDLSGVKAGDSVAFTLKPGANDDYSIVGIKTVK